MAGAGCLLHVEGYYLSVCGARLGGLLLVMVDPVHQQIRGRLTVLIRKWRITVLSP